jgi:hypothetical protein
MVISRLILFYLVFLQPSYLQEEKVKELVEKLVDKEDKVREKALRELIEMGEEDKVIKKLNGVDNKGELLTSISNLLSNKAPLIRAGAIRIIANLTDDKKYLDRIKKLVNDEDDLVQCEAMQAMIKSGRTGFIGQMISTLKGPKDMYKSFTIQKLNACYNPSFYKKIREKKIKPVGVNLNNVKKAIDDLQKQLGFDIVIDKSIKIRKGEDIGTHSRNGNPHRALTEIIEDIGAVWGKEVAYILEGEKIEIAPLKIAIERFEKWYNVVKVKK